MATMTSSKNSSSIFKRKQNSRIAARIETMALWQLARGTTKSQEPSVPITRCIYSIQLTSQTQSEQLQRLVEKASSQTMIRQR